MKGIPIFMYHALEDAGHPAGSLDPGEQRYVLEVERFAAQLAFLKSEGFQSFLASDLESLTRVPERAVVLTFDDGHASNLTLTLPLLEKYGFRAEFFVTTDWIGAPRFLSRDGIRSLQAAGMGIGSHGASHAFLSQLKPADLERELRDSREILGDITGASIASLSAPGGRIGPEVAAAAVSLGYRTLFTSLPGLWSTGGSLHELPRLALRNNLDQATFERLALAEEGALRQVSRKEGLLASARKLLGERGYRLVRSVLLGGCLHG
ncbi:polysaccharide deacetylase family protein [Geomonas sp. Red32]|uniref:polysaccharide deacetylase family protein n=1 Tax=Geomonas sp. Red32 TaxID=2912856 RepID=UPI00202CBB4C|nr:polysaccharide deacetylase family protein [Geomonas sp. Red32]MCM0083366.1 polysaccharide deacetylase family protein [Geomonas sp. Red32]